MAACEICKTKSSLHQNVIFKNAGQITPITLCAAHDQELFLIGQFRFIQKYKDQLHSSFHLEGGQRKIRDDDAA